MHSRHQLQSFILIKVADDFLQRRHTPIYNISSIELQYKCADCITCHQGMLQALCTGKELKSR